MNRFLSGIEKAGHDFKVAGKDTGKGAIKVAEVAAPIAIPIVTHGLVSGSEVSSVLGMFKKSQEESPMNPMEALGVQVAISTLQFALKNPATRATVQAQLCAVSTDILEDYGYTVTAPAATTATATKGA